MSFFLPVRTHRQGRKSEKRPKPKESSSKKGKATSQTPLSFVFVINKLSFIEEGNGTSPNVDRWGNPLPPNTSQSYGSETPGKVWRYNNGSISPAGEGFYWYRENLGLDGAIWGPVDMTTNDGQRYWGSGPLEEHRTFSVFNCWRFLPCLYADIDVTTVDEMGVDHRWFPLEFSRDSDDPGATHPPPTGPVRGIVVQVCCDPYNPYGSTLDDIDHFEATGKLIVE
ncbi:hypothetical protein CGLO_03646 [Colletotrichum gloeosporioides Cg-14]|uniref:Uncharacterized protein n=1 Tax=Colletotrichum gloeosporioides (strain Cg-14) TaxID=1237896 RepID=T0M645_COLGC|nr:hypothetical protein CGLO_03646 [Colletotrichum gloeosporioides Cg-14]